MIDGLINKQKKYTKFNKKKSSTDTPLFSSFTNLSPKQSLTHNIHNLSTKNLIFYYSRDVYKLRNKSLALNFSHLSKRIDITQAYFVCLRNFKKQAQIKY